MASQPYNKYDGSGASSGKMLHKRIVENANINEEGTSRYFEIIN